MEEAIEVLVEEELGMNPTFGEGVLGGSAVAGAVTHPGRWVRLEDSGLIVSISGFFHSRSCLENLI